MSFPMVVCNNKKEGCGFENCQHGKPHEFIPQKCKNSFCTVAAQKICNECEKNTDCVIVKLVANMWSYEQRLVALNKNTNAVEECTKLAGYFISNCECVPIRSK